MKKPIRINCECFVCGGPLTMLVHPETKTHTARAEVTVCNTCHPSTMATYDSSKEFTQAKFTQPILVLRESTYKWWKKKLTPCKSNKEVTEILREKLRR